MNSVILLFDLATGLKDRNSRPGAHTSASLGAGLKRSERDVEHAPLSSAGDETEWRPTCTSALWRYGMYGTSLPSTILACHSTL